MIFFHHNLILYSRVYWRPKSFGMLKRSCTAYKSQLRTSLLQSVCSDIPLEACSQQHWWALTPQRLANTTYQVFFVFCYFSLVESQWLNVYLYTSAYKWDSKGPAAIFESVYRKLCEILWCAFIDKWMLENTFFPYVSYMARTVGQHTKVFRFQ